MEDQSGFEIKISDREKAFAATGHLISLLGQITFIISLALVAFDIIIKNNLYVLYILIIPVIVNVAIPLIYWNRTKSISFFVDEHCKQSLNFQVSITLYFVISIAAVFIAIGVILLFVLILFDISTVIEAFKKAKKGEEYHYPLSIRFVR